jgi:two-component system OmpR family sensor kinase
VRGSIRTRLLWSFLLVAVAAAAALSVYFLKQAEAFGVRRLEDHLLSEGRVSAAMMGSAISSVGGVSTSGGTGTRMAQTLAKASAGTASRAIVVDPAGVVVADSARSATGDNIRDRNVVAQALKGREGTASSRLGSGRIALSVAVPVKSGRRTVGAIYLTGSSFSVFTVLLDYWDQLALAVVAFLVLAFLLTELLTRRLTAPLRELQAGATALASDHSVRVNPTGPRELRDLALAFNELAEEIESSSVELHEEERRKSRFVSDVSHELRSPLTGIRLAAETLLEGDVDELDQTRFLQTIIREADRLTGLANDLLELQRIEGATGELPLGRVDFTQTTRLAIEASEPLAAERGVAIEVTGTAPDVLGSRDRLQQVVGNLIDNATRHTPRGAKVTAALSQEGDDAVLRIIDEGPGIPQGDLAHLFQRFYRAQYSRDRKTGGAGLGLAIVKAIVAAHHGTIEAANRPEGGAVFTVRLPMIKDRS